MLLLIADRASHGQQVTIGSKAFTESYVLGEIAKKVLTDAGLTVQHKKGMGGTIILWQALKSGGIDAYPDYTGTISREILKRGDMTQDEMRAALRPLGVGLTADLGFNDGYAFVMMKEKARKLGITRTSDLRNHPELITGLTHEFMVRADGWPAVSAKYGLHMTNVRGMQHDLAYRSLAAGQIDLQDAYTTDAEIGEYDLAVLEDDLHFFPLYRAVFLYRLDTAQKAVEALHKLEGTIDEAKMIRMNAEAKRTRDFVKGASLYFGREARSVAESQAENLGAQIAKWTGRHVFLSGVSLFFAILVGVPLGIAASRPGVLSHTILALVGIVQTIPSLALLAMLIPIMGINASTAIFALFLYSLLPIVRNTATGLQDIPAPLRESAAALGLEPFAQLRKVYLPMASRTILAGIKTSAIINVGTATLAALIGAGGLGEPIIQGLNVNDTRTILAGAIPAAILALLVQSLFDLMDRLLIPRGLRLQSPGG